MPDPAQRRGLLVDVPDTVVWVVVALGLLAAAWFALKALGRRGRLLGAYRRLDPSVQAARAWVAAAPATFTYMAMWTATSIVQQGQPTALAELTAALNSTNIANLMREPVRVLIASAVLVADHAVGFLGYVVVYVLVVARLEHRVGSARWLSIAGASHVVGTLLTVAVERVGLARDLLPGTIIVAQDIGVSYVMVGAAGAYLWLVSPAWRWPYRAALGISLLGPLIVVRSIWDLGHLLAALVGTAVGWAAVHGPLREPLRWRALLRCAPRPLPTFRPAAAHSCTGTTEGASRAGPLD